MTPPTFAVQAGPAGGLEIVFSGAWRLSQSPPSAETIFRALDADPDAPVTLSVRELESWDSSLLAPMYAAARRCGSRSVKLDYSGLPAGLRGLLRLALAVPRRDPPAAPPREWWVGRLGAAALRAADAALAVSEFVGEIVLASFRFVTGRTRLRRNDFLEIVEQAGPSALGIVTLISVLVGLILAYIGAIQLRQFGAQIYVANLVGIAMAREMAGIMVGIILAGRTGAAFAAQLGTMQVNEEIDALRTLGISPIHSLVVPRMIALVGMIPLLCLYAIAAGIVGGILVSVGVLGISLPLYWEQTIISVRLNDVWVGLAKSVVFGALVALCGCYHGMRCGRSASAVGQATTAAVVSGIVCVVIADAVFAVLCDIVGI